MLTVLGHVNIGLIAGAFLVGAVVELSERDGRLCCFGVPANWV